MIKKKTFDTIKLFAFKITQQYPKDELTRTHIKSVIVIVTIHKLY